MNFDKGVLNLYSIAGEIKIIGKTLKEVEAMLSTSFFSINRSQIVNLNFIESIDVQDVVKLRGKSVVLYVSRYRRKELKQKVRGTLLDD